MKLHNLFISLCLFLARYYNYREKFNEAEMFIKIAEVNIKLKKSNYLTN